MPKIGRAHVQCALTVACCWIASKIRMAFLFLNGCVCVWGGVLLFLKYVAHKVKNVAYLSFFRKGLLTSELSP